jgi:hypothetical protein
MYTWQKFDDYSNCLLSIFEVYNRNWSGISNFQSEKIMYFIQYMYLFDGEVRFSSS